jgi:uncharacterized protein
MKSLLLAFATFLGASALAQPNSLLYSVKKPGKKSSFLFGTTHIIADSAFYFPQKLEKTLSKTDALVLEVGDIGDQAKAVSLMKLESGSAFDIFTKEQADSVIAWGSQQLNMSPDAFVKGFSGRKPFALMQISVQAMLKVPVRFYEIELMSRAVAEQKPILGLESMEYQLSLFDELPDSVLAGMILSPIRFPGESEEMERELTRLYIAQDVEGLAEMLTDLKAIGGNTETLVIQRNRNWIPAMDKLMDERSCFFAVGAGHLGGDQGVINLLRDAGYVVTPVHY